MSSFNLSSPPVSNKLIRLFSYVALVFSIIFGIWYQICLLDYREWGDESETIVAAKMLARGMSLYSEVFNHHGPLTFLTGYIIELFGNFSIREHRIPIAVLQWLAIISIYFSPLNKNISERNIYIAIAIAATISLLPENNLYGHTYTYQVLCGIFLVIIISQLTIPSIIDSKSISPVGFAIGNLLISSLPFLAVTYMPAAGLLYLASLRLGTIKRSIYYLAVGLIANIIFLGLIGSFKGYLAYHIYLNAEILPLYNNGHGLFIFAKNIVSAISSSIEGLMSFAGLLFILSILINKDESRISWRTGFLTLAILSLLMRGHAIHGVPFWYCYITLFVIIACQNEMPIKQKLLWSICSIICILKLVYPLLISKNYFKNEYRKEVTEFSQLVKNITDEKDKIIAYSFRNYEYLASDRLPASGHFFYLPWQEKYNENPKLGIAISACKEIDEYRPKIMLIDKWIVWGRYDWNTYAGCVQTIIDKFYSQLPDRPYYIRNDLFDKAINYHKQSLSQSRSNK